MADEDDEPTEPEEEIDESELDVDALDVEELDPELSVGDDEDFESDDDAEVDEEEDDDDEEEATPRTRRTTAEEEDEDDEDLLSPDDVEADLDRILKDRMVAADEADDDEDDDDQGLDETGERGDGSGRLQPKRADEQLCGSCFLLVRSSAPSCPVGDDDCPIFRS